MSQRLHEDRAAAGLEDALELRKSSIEVQVMEDRDPGDELDGSVGEVEGVRVGDQEVRAIGERVLGDASSCQLDELLRDVERRDASGTAVEQLERQVAVAASVVDDVLVARVEEAVKILVPVEGTFRALDPAPCARVATSPPTRVVELPLSGYAPPKGVLPGRLRGRDSFELIAAICVIFPAEGARENARPTNGLPGLRDRVVRSRKPARGQRIARDRPDDVQEHVVERRRSPGDEEVLCALHHGRSQQGQSGRAAKADPAQVQRGAERQEQNDVGRRLEQENDVRAEYGMSDLAERSQPDLVVAFDRKQREARDGDQRRCESDVGDGCARFSAPWSKLRDAGTISALAGGHAAAWAHALRTRTNSASSASDGFRLNSSSARQVSRTASAAPTAPSPAPTAMSSRMSSSRSA